MPLAAHEDDILAIVRTLAIPIVLRAVADRENRYQYVGCAWACKRSSGSVLDNEQWEKDMESEYKGFRGVLCDYERWEEILEVE